MLTNLTGHWLMGLPLGSLLAFGLGYGVVGMWVGLSTGLMVVGVVLVTTWHRRARALADAPPLSRAVSSGDQREDVAGAVDALAGR